MKVLVFGNILIEKDNLALKLIPKLQIQFPEIEFKEFDPTENLENEIEDGRLRILDVAEDIDKIMIIDDIKKLVTSKIYSMHDFDLAFNLKLLKKVGKLKNVEIIAIPDDMKEEDVFNKIKDILANINH